VVFVSHDLSAVEATCTRGMWLDFGVVRADGPVGEVMSSYRRSIEEMAETAPPAAGPIKLLKVEVRGERDGPIRTQGPLEIDVVLEAEREQSGHIHLGVSDGPATAIFSLRRDLYLSPGETSARCAIAHLPLPHGRFYLWMAIFMDTSGTRKETAAKADLAKTRELLAWHPAARFDVEGPPLDPAPRAIVRLAPVHVDVQWQVHRP
jgi:ABC-type glutathione transport system ATPase component